MDNYSNGKIYKICSHMTDKIYIGSTKQSLTERFRGHMTDYRRFIRLGWGGTSASDILKYEDSYINLIEDYPCDSKQELEIRERQILLQNIGIFVNRNISL